jgi:hypothetical protein
MHGTEVHAYDVLLGNTERNSIKLHRLPCVEFKRLLSHVG